MVKIVLKVWNLIGLAKLFLTRKFTKSKRSEKYFCLSQIEHLAAKIESSFNF